MSSMVGTTVASRAVEELPAISCQDLSVRYGDLIAVDGLTLSVDAGEVVALLGPNGAGKTSTLACLEGYRRPDGGRVSVLGLDPVRERRQLVPRLGVMLQGGGVYPTMRAREVLELFAAYYDAPRSPTELLALLGLEAAASTPWRRLSGGEQQRLSLALALLNRPAVCFLDEPTAGVDPEGRQVIRQVVAALRESGSAVLLTSHELHEVDAVADRLVFLHEGRLLAAGSAAELSATLGHGAGFTATPGLDRAALAAALGATVVEPTPGRYRIETTLDAGGLARLGAAVESQGATVQSVDAAGSLEDLYYALYQAAPQATPPEPSRRRRRR